MASIAVQVNVRLSPILFARLEAEEKRTGQSRTAVVAAALDAQLPQAIDRLKSEGKA